MFMKTINQKKRTFPPKFRAGDAGSRSGERGSPLSLPSLDAVSMLSSDDSCQPCFDFDLKLKS